jgi:magnesium-transporting ATPase (P-type)
LQSLRSGRDGISGREAERRLLVYGRNELRRQGGRRWPQQLAAQFTHPLALLLWLAAALAFIGGTALLGAAILDAGSSSVKRSRKANVSLWR